MNKYCNCKYLTNNFFKKDTKEIKNLNSKTQSVMF